MLSARDTLKENSVPDDLAGLTAAALAISVPIIGPQARYPDIF